VTELNTTIMMNLIDNQGYFIGIFQSMNYYTNDIFQYLVVGVLYLTFFIVLRINEADAIKTITVSAFATFVLSVFLIIMGAVDKTTLVMILILTATSIIFKQLID
jgi:hypothetical protein